MGEHTTLEAMEQRVKTLESAMAAFLRAIVDVAIRFDDDWHWCVFCDVSLPVRDADHEPGCAYVAAKKLLKEMREGQGR